MPRLCVIEGDGIGKEVIPQAVRVLSKVIPDLEIISAEAGWECFLQTGTSVPEETLEKIRFCGTALFGAVSSPSKKVPGYRSAILTLRQYFDLYANLRPVLSLPVEPRRKNVNMMIVRENTEGMYSGRERVEGDTAIAERVITRQASKRIGKKAISLAIENNYRRVTIVHKANILPITDGLFRDSILQSAEEMDLSSTNILMDEMLVDTAAYQIASNPEQFGIIVTTNLFGDILSDEAAIWCGGIGMAPSINFGEQVSIAEPVHGSAPDIAGKGISNPIASILSGALLAKYTWNLPEVASRIVTAVNSTLLDGVGNAHSPFSNNISTNEITQTILNHLVD